MWSLRRILCIIQRLYYNRIKCESECQYEKKVLKNDISKEGVMIPDSNTVIDPWAMMIEPLYTLVTYSAMPRPGSSDGLAIWT
jgi:hypothetical protein